MSQSEKERKEASKQAFEVLLVRLTGRRDLAETEIGKVLIENARLYVSSFRYELIKEKVFESVDVMPVRSVLDDEPPMQQEPIERQSIEDEEPELKPTQKLVVRFDEKAVKNSLWKQKLPVWGKTRPSTLLWVAVQDQNKRVLLDANEPTALLSYIERQAEKRGIPMLYPLTREEAQNI